MLIVSQNKDYVSNTETLLLIDVDMKTIHIVVGSHARALFGVYENTERCKGVLQEIWSAHANGEKVFFMPEN